MASTSISKTRNKYTKTTSTNSIVQTSVNISTSTKPSNQQSNPHNRHLQTNRYHGSKQDQLKPSRSGRPLRRNRNRQAGSSEFFLHSVDEKVSKLSDLNDSSLPVSALGFLASGPTPAIRPKLVSVPLTMSAAALASPPRSPEPLVLSATTWYAGTAGCTGGFWPCPCRLEPASHCLLHWIPPGWSLWR